MSQTLTKAEPIPATEPTSMIAVIARAASDPNTDIDKLERLMAMKERMDAKQAESDFNAAMARVQSQMGRVSADARNAQTKSNYATYGALDRALRPIYTAEGMSLSFSTEDAPEGHVGMVCYVSHTAGHTRTYRAQVPSDGKGAKGGDVMTKTHAFGSGTSYGMRYLLKMIFNVAIGEDDDDGNAAGDEEDPKYADWFAALDERNTVAGLHEVKAELKQKFGDNIPKQIIAHYNQRLDAIKGANP